MQLNPFFSFPMLCNQPIIEVLNLHGQTMYVSNTESNVVHIEIENFSDGVYIVKVGDVAQKFIKQ